MESSQEDVEKILDLLSSSCLPLSTREVCVRLRLRRIRVPDYEVGRILRESSSEGKLTHSRGKWITNTPEKRLTFDSPSLSPEALAILGRSQIPAADPTHPKQKSSAPEEAPPSDLYSGRWGMFRKLVAYYRQCVRQEEGSEASSFQNELGKTFVYLRKMGNWYPRPGLRWQSVVPIGPHLSPLLNSLPGEASDQDLVLGYPIHAYYAVRNGEPSYAVIRPVFFFPVSYSIGNSGLMVSCDEARPEINLGWFDFAFSRRSERQRSFLSACGLLNRSQPIDEPIGLERGEIIPSLNVLTTALSAFMPDKIRESLNLDNVPGTPLNEPFKTGIYNRSVLMLARRTKYTANLLRELAAIEKASDDTLDRTSLRHFFAADRAVAKTEEFLHEAVVAETLPLNAEQREATASLLIRDVSVIAGPPGTGKSQVVSSTIANARIRGQTVLFASRNHKAIDAVMARLPGPEGRPIVVRTNSKDDPGLRYTFAHAIRDMLSCQPRPDAKEHLRNAQEEIIALLDERGRNAMLARKLSEIGAALGEIEERKSFLAKELPDEMIQLLEQKPELFPSFSVRRILGLCRKGLCNTDAGTIGRFLGWILALRTLPWCRIAGHGLKQLPNAPELPFALTPPKMNQLVAELSILERASEYVRLLVESKPHEQTLTEFPALEFLTGIISDLSQRIEQVSNRAVGLDLKSRCNLDEELNRELLDGLRAALNAMQTGLDEAKINQEAVRVVEAQSPKILNSFPCWAVTNLSVGSRIPFVPALFDLAIVDEASQSDIPSAIPLLFRAKRAGVVGDPFQLSFVSKLSTAKDTLLRRQLGLRRVEDVRFAYTESSLFNLFASTNDVTPVFLSETYRSVADIAGYCSSTFYGDRLRVATNEIALPRPHGMAKGIHWTNVAGEIQAAGGGGCICQQEIDTLVQVMRSILLANEFLGTVGVVTPFRQQANRLRDALFESDSKLYEVLHRSKVHVDTAHGFQGDERDVIFFSLCAGPDMPAGSHAFLRETGYLFNVAASRARAVLHVIGNLGWAKKCGIRHIEKLALPRAAAMEAQPGPWFPHESPWELKLYIALSEAGLKPRPQFQVAGRRLDLALIGEGVPSLKIDIEVDGDCHRNPDGTRKIDDLWRDIQLQGMGWKVMRFWTYRLREEMGACVAEVLQAWSNR